MSVDPSMPQSSLGVMELPEYVTIRNLQEANPILRNPARALTFPLSEADHRDSQILEAKFEGEANCTG